MDRVKKSNKDVAKLNNSLSAANGELAKTKEKLVKLNRELVAASKELERISEQVKHQKMRQREIIHNASQDLRTSTQCILGYAEILLSESQSMSGYLEPVTRCAVSSQQIIFDILDFKD